MILALSMVKTDLTCTNVFAQHESKAAAETLSICLLWQPSCLIQPSSDNHMLTHGLWLHQYFQKQNAMKSRQPEIKITATQHKMH